MIPKIGEDGFHYYTCKLCGLEKMAAMFTPSELLPENGLRCRKCCGEVNSKRHKEKNVPPPSQDWRNSYHSPVGGGIVHK